MKLNPTGRRGTTENRRRTKIVSLVLGLSIAIGGSWALTRSRVFALSRIDVAGVSAIQRQQVLDASGLRIGAGALSPDLKAVAARVARLPWVASVRAEREGSLGIRIIVVSRVAVARINAGDQSWFVDSGGAVVDTGAGANLPIIELPDLRSLVDNGSSAEEQVAAALAVWSRLPRAMRAEVRSLTPDAAGNVVFSLGAAAVYFGDATRATEKLRAIQLVVERVAIEHRHLRSVNVMAPDHPSAQIS